MFILFKFLKIFFNFCFFIYFLALHYYYSVLYNIKELWEAPKFAKITTKNKNIVITGATTGIGLETVKQLCRPNYKIIIGSNIYGEVELLLKKSHSIIFEHLNLEDSQSIFNFVDKVVECFNDVDIIYNNAGVALYPNYSDEKIVTISDIKISDATFIINFLGHTLLTLYLLYRIRVKKPDKYQFTPIRIINTSSVLHKIAWLDLFNLDASTYYSPHAFYGRSKLAVTTWTKALTKAFQNSKSYKSICLYSFHPGIVYNERLYARFHPLIVKTVIIIHKLGLLKTNFRASQNLLYLGFDEITVPKLPGAYFENMEPVKPNKCALDIQSQYEVLKLTVDYAKKCYRIHKNTIYDENGLTFDAFLDDIFKNFLLNS